MDTMSARINKIEARISRLKSNKNITQKEAIEYWHSAEVQELKNELAQAEIIDPPKFKVVVGVTGVFADFLFDGLPVSKYSDFL